MGNDIKITIKNENKISQDANRLINEVQKKLVEKNFIWQDDNFISDSEKGELDKISKTLTNAKVIVHKDGKGATVVSSSGAFVIIGKEEVAKGTDQTEGNTPKQFEYACEEALNSLKQNTIISSCDKTKLEKLDDILSDVVIIVSDNEKSVLIADSTGKYKEVSNQDNTRKSVQIKTR